MAAHNSKTSFTGEELTRIISLVRQLEMAEPSKKKGIRENLRKIGLYWLKSLRECLTQLKIYVCCSRAKS